MPSMYAPKPTLSFSRPEFLGFLPRGNELFAADVYVAAMGRSGSTVLCDLMSHSMHVCLIEPRFDFGVFDQHIRTQILNAGVVIAEDSWGEPGSRDNAGLRDRYRRGFVPSLCQMVRWGAKEVRPELHEPTIDTINAKRIVVLVRDARDVMCSYYEKIVHGGGDHEGSVNYVSGYLPKAAETLALLASRPNAIVARYEDFTKSASDLRSLERRMDWPLIGKPNASFSSIARAAEAERHKGAVTPAQAYDRESSLDFMASTLEQCATYQRTFGYD